MNSEKVKEIKEKLKERYYCLDQGYSDHLAYGGKADEQQEEEIYFLGDILTLIHKLESENERLNKAINNVQKGFDNGEFISKDCKVMALKQFAERLKDKVVNTPHILGGEITIIDETLEEFIGDGR
jgi:hypothetical protein